MRTTSIVARSVAACALIVTIAATPATAVPSNSYTVHPLVSDIAGTAPVLDPQLVNPWGLASNQTGGAWWVADNGTGVSTLYTILDGAAIKAALEVAVPGGAPTGAVFNGGPGFVVTNGVDSHPALFIFAGEGGIISGWNPGVLPATTAKVAAVREGAIYTGLAIGELFGESFLYAADFHNARVDVFDDSFRLTTLAGSFVDPSLPAGYAPFGIQTIGGRIFVTYAKQNAAADDVVAGQGLGFVNAFDVNGNLVARVAERGQLNAPWGLALAPVAGFGRFSGDLLVGNFGDGEITAVGGVAGGVFEVSGQLRGGRRGPIAIDGLWALGFGNGITTGPRNTLFFTAGPDDEAHGLFGSITAD
jgi:uncharacterized protein (TIGR03118 family)